MPLSTKNLVQADTEPLQRRGRHGIALAVSPLFHQCPITQEHDPDDAVGGVNDPVLLHLVGVVTMPALLIW